MEALSSIVRLSCLLLIILVGCHCEASFMDGVRTPVNFSNVESSYIYLRVNADDEWVLKPYAKIAESSLAHLRNKPPYNLIKYIIQWARGMPSSSGEKVRKAFVLYNTPYSVLALMSFVFAVVLAILGILYCSMSYHGKYNLLPQEAESMSIRHNSCYLNIACLGVCAMFIFMSGLIILSGRHRLNEGVSLARSLVDNTFENLLEFQNKTFTDLHFVLVRQLDEVCDGLVDNIHEFSRKVVNATRAVTPSSVATTNTLIALGAELPSLNSSFSQLLDELVNAQKSYVDDLIALESRVHEINANLSITKDLCTKNATLNSTGICQSPELNPTMIILANKTAFPRVSRLFSVSLARLAGQNLTGLAHNINATISVYEEKVYEKTTLRRSDLQKIARIMKEQRDISFKYVEDILLHGMNDKIIEKSKQAVAVLDDGGVVWTIGKTVTAIMAVVSALTLFAGILLVCSILSGMPVMVFTDKEMLKGFLPKFAYRMARGTLYQLSICSVPMLVICCIMIGICGTLTQTCIGLNDDSILENIGDDIDTWSGRLLGLTKIVPNIPEQITLIQTVNNCGQSENSTVWHSAGIENAFDIRRKLKLNKIEDPIVFFKLDNLFNAGGVVESFLLLKESAQNLSKGLGALNSSIDYTGPLLMGNLTEYGANLTLFSKRFEKYDMDLGRIFGSWGRAITETLNDAADKARNSREQLRKVAKNVIKKGNETVWKVNEAIASGIKTKHLIDTVKQKFTNGTRKALQVIDQFINHLDKQLNENIGKCEFIYEAYTKGKLIYCSYIVNGLNIIWLSLGVTILMFTLSMFSFVNVVYYFRLKMLEDREHFAEVGKNSDGNSMNVKDSLHVAHGVEVEDVSSKSVNEVKECGSVIK